MRRLIPFVMIVLFLAGAPPLAGAAPVSATADAQSEQQLQVGGPPEAAKLSFQEVESGKLLVTVTDSRDEPVKGLTTGSFTIKKGPRSAKILSVEPLQTSKEIGLNIIMVVDNSKSMEQRQAVKPLLQALNEFCKTVRPIDNIHLVVFDETGTKAAGGRDLHARTLDSHDAAAIGSFLSQSMHEGMTNGTYLYDAMAAGLDIARALPEKQNKFLVVFSDGEDINSVVKRPDIEKAAAGIPNLSAYAVDYMPRPQTDDFLREFSATHGGRIWKASAASDLLPVFRAFSTTLLHRYVVTYRFLEAPAGRLAFGSPELVIEEVTTIDSAPLLNAVYFDTGQGTLPERYVLLRLQSETAAFSEKGLKEPIEKYRNVLNVIGKRLQDHPGAGVRLVGCNSNIGPEKGRIDLSLQRAEAVRAYLQYLWNIDAGRISIEKRNLPELPSASRLPEGQAENQRVEIYSDDPAILDTVDSEYAQKVSDTREISIAPAITAEAGVGQWAVALKCGDNLLTSFEGKGEPPKQLTFPLASADIDRITSCDRLTAGLQATDLEGRALTGDTEIALPVRYIRRQEQMAQKQGYRVKEQYALILFDFNSSAIKERNQVIVNRIIERIRQIPNALVSVTGHTDTIGSEEYNMKLSQKRAEAVRDQFLAQAPTLSGNLFVRGVGPNEPLYDNSLPEGRALNRTVTITLEYLQN